MSAFELLVAQHRELEECLAQLDGAPPEELGALAAELASLLRLHSGLEEAHLSVLLSRLEGGALAREEAEEHLVMRELVDELLALSPGSDAWFARLMALEDVVVAHIQWEEARVLPQLSAALDSSETERLREALKATAAVCSARERPHVPGGGPSPHAPRWGV